MKFRFLSTHRGDYPNWLKSIIWQSPNSGMRPWHKGTSLAVFRSFKTGRLRFHLGSASIA